MQCTVLVVMDIDADPQTLHKKLLFCNIINIIISLVPGEMSKQAAHTCAQFKERNTVVIPCDGRRVNSSRTRARERFRSFAVTFRFNYSDWKKAILFVLSLFYCCALLVIFTHRMKRD